MMQTSNMETSYNFKDHNELSDLPMEIQCFYLWKLLNLWTLVLSQLVPNVFSQIEESQGHLLLQGSDVTQSYKADLLTFTEEVSPLAPFETRSM